MYSETSETRHYMKSIDLPGVAGDPPTTPSPAAVDTEPGCACWGDKKLRLALTVAERETALPPRPRSMADVDNLRGSGTSVSSFHCRVYRVTGAR